MWLAGQRAESRLGSVRWASCPPTQQVWRATRVRTPNLLRMAGQARTFAWAKVDQCAEEQSDRPKSRVSRYFDGIIFCRDIGHRSRSSRYLTEPHHQCGWQVNVRRRDSEAFAGPRAYERNRFGVLRELGRQTCCEYRGKPGHSLVCCLCCLCFVLPVHRD